MSALPFLITNAGNSALAAATLSTPVNLATIQIGSGAFTPAVTVTALQTEIKSLTPVGSSLPSTGMVHMTFQDNTSAAYSVTEIGIFTSGGTLFAYYSNATPFLIKTAGNVALFSIDLALTNVTPGTVTIGSASFQYPPATETTAGVAQIATTAQVNAGTDDATIVSPSHLHAYLTANYLPLAGGAMDGNINMNGNAVSNSPCVAAAAVTFSVSSSHVVTLLRAYNVTSVYRESQGIYLITFTNPMSTANYAVMLVSTAIEAGNTPAVLSTSPNFAPPTLMTNYEVEIVNGTGEGYADPGYCSVVVFDI